MPVGAGELTVLVVTQSAQDHGQSLIPGDGVIGAEGTGVVALDVLGVGAEVDVAGVPRGRRDVVELVVVGVDADLGVSHIAGDDAVDDGGDLSAGDSALGQEAAVIVALEHLQAGQDSHGGLVGIRDAVVIREGVGGGHQRQAHDQSQGQCENLLQISHCGFFLLLNFLGKKVVELAIYTVKTVIK